MKIHTLKIFRCYLKDIERGKKTWEIRKNDRDFKEGDIIHFVDQDSEEFFEYPDNLFRITYILQNINEYGLQEGYCIFSIEKLN